jgi:hypothetical protein
VVQVGLGQEVRTDHFQTVASGSVASKHQSCRLNRPLDDWHLALVQFELDNLPRFVSRSVSSLSTSCLISSFGITRALCNQVELSKCCLSLLASFDDESRLPFVEYLEQRTEGVSATGSHKPEKEMLGIRTDKDRYGSHREKSRFCLSPTWSGLRRVVLL